VIVNKNDYNTIDNALKKLIAYELLESISNIKDKEKLYELLNVFECFGYDILSKIESNNADEHYVIEKVKFLSEKLLTKGVKSMPTSEVVEIIGGFTRLYNLIYLNLNYEEKEKVIYGLFEQHKKSLNKKTSLFGDFITREEKNIKTISNDFTVKANDANKTISAILTGFMNEEEKRKLFRQEVFEKQSIFEQEIQNKQNEFHNELMRQLGDMQDSVYRKKLSGYFLEEHEKLKGEVSVKSLFSIIILFIIVVVSLTFCTDIIKGFKNISNYNYEVIISVFLLFSLILFGIYKLMRNIFSQSENKNISKDFWLYTPYWGWLSAALFGMCLILGTATNLYLFGNEIDYKKLLQRVPLFMVLIWYTWFCAKQFSYYKQICDEYEYKYLLSMSYLSYRKEAQELSGGKDDNVLIVSLLDSVIKNIATSPVQAVKQDCHTPFAEVANVMKMSFGKDNNSSKD